MCCALKVTVISLNTFLHIRLLAPINVGKFYIYFLLIATTIPGSPDERISFQRRYFS